jgi:hypothetical protein
MLQNLGTFRMATDELPDTTPLLVRTYDTHGPPLQAGKVLVTAVSWVDGYWLDKPAKDGDNRQVVIVE